MKEPEPDFPARPGHNFRDMGGYRTSDGRQVRRGLLFRSGLMTGLSESDQMALRGMGIAAIFDLRDNEERDRRPTLWHEDSSITYYFRDYNQSIGDLGDSLRSGDLTPERITAIITDIYRRLPFEQAEAYAQLMTLLVEGRLPLIFNCTAGKDRTGIFAALILYALDVPRAAIEEDYALSNLAVDQLVQIMAADPRFAAISSLPANHYLPLMRAEAAYLAIAFDAIMAECGSIDHYLLQHLGLDKPRREALRRHLLE